MTSASLPASRLLAFLASSIALHVLVLSACVPGLQGRATGIGPAPLHAALVPFLDTRTAANDVVQDFKDATGDSAAAPAAETRANTAIPAPDRWFPAEELSVRAEPLDNVHIDYPPELAASGALGAVRLLLHIDERGFVRKAHVEASLPHDAFGDAALNAWKQVRFTPAQKDGVAVKSRKRLEISFSP
jgi:protein TonB